MTGKILNYCFRVKMVNTFLVYSDFSKSASTLDNKRLAKQRVEAYQILNILSDLNFISNHFNIVCPEAISKTNGLKIREWIKDIAKKYKSLDYYFIYLDDNYIKIPKTLSLRDSNFSKYRKVGLGFCYHPAVRLWYGHRNSLKRYINCHIQEWINRGFKNNMKLYEVKRYRDPFWVKLKEFHEKHRGSLLYKDFKYYSKYFKNVIAHYEYIWY